MDSFFGKFGKYEYRQPLMTDNEGLYITVAQMNFFFNRRNGVKKFEEASPEFISYYNHCRLYNLIYDMMEKDPDCAVIFWDNKNEGLGISFPMKGKVAKALSRVKSVLDTEDEDDDSDPFALFS
jgi:hypothetical protein